MLIDDPIAIRAIQILASAPNGMKKADLMSALNLRSKASQETLWELLTTMDGIELAGNGKNFSLKYAGARSREITPAISHEWEDSDDISETIDAKAIRRIWALFEERDLVTQSDLKNLRINIPRLRRIISEWLASEKIIMVPAGKTRHYRKAKNISE